jgi:hypothetical protein
MRAILILCATVAGCTSVEAPRIVGVQPTVVWGNDAPAEPPHKLTPMSVDEARSIALAHDAAHTCEETARALRAKDRQRGWAVMHQCILRPDFTDLEIMVSDPWREDLMKVPDWGNLVAHVIAVRGGDVQSDLRVCRRARVPLFSLKAALAEPDAYTGKLVLMRGSPGGGRTVLGYRAVDLNETKVMAESAFVSTGARLDTGTQTDTTSRAGHTFDPQLQERTQSQTGTKSEVLHNVSVETGLDIVAQVSGDAPFLESGTDYVLVIRFEGTRGSVDESSTNGERAIATVVGYYEPESGLFARLGR